MGAFFAAYRAPALQPEAALAVSGWHGSHGLAWFVGLTGLADRLTGLADRLAWFVGLADRLTGLTDRLAWFVGLTGLADRLTGLTDRLD